MGLTLAYSNHKLPNSKKKMLRCAPPLQRSQANTEPLSPSASKLDRLRKENPLCANVVDELIDRFLEE